MSHLSEPPINFFPHQKILYENPIGFAMDDHIYLKLALLFWLRIFTDIQVLTRVLRVLSM